MGRRGWFSLGAVLGLGLLGMSPPPATADSLRCGRKLVSDGDTLYDVRNRCGEPDNQIHRVETRTVGQWVQGQCINVDPRRCGQYVQRTIEIVIDEWTYDFGPHQFISYVTFENGRLISIVSGARGVKDK
jgi:hypothetical protein